MGGALRGHQHAVCGGAQVAFVAQMVPANSGDPKLPTLFPTHFLPTPESDHAVHDEDQCEDVEDGEGQAHEELGSVVRRGAVQSVNVHGHVQGRGTRAFTFAWCPVTGR